MKCCPFTFQKKITNYERMVSPLEAHEHANLNKVPSSRIHPHHTCKVLRELDCSNHENVGVASPPSASQVYMSENCAPGPAIMFQPEALFRGNRHDNRCTTYLIDRCVDYRVACIRSVRQILICCSIFLSFPSFSSNFG